MVLDDQIGFGKRALDVADDLDDLAHDVARAFVDGRRRRAHRGLGVDHGRPRLVLDPDQLGCVGGPVWIGRDHGDDRLADVADLAAGKRPLGPRRVEADIGVRAIRARRGEWVSQPGKIVGEKHRHVRQRAGRRRVHGDDSGPCVSRAHEGEVHDTGWGDVVDEATSAGNQPLVLFAPWRLADHGKRVLGRLRVSCRRRSACDRPRSRARDRRAPRTAGGKFCVGRPGAPRHA